MTRSPDATHQRTWYMHTLDGHPAVYLPRGQICFAGGYGKWGAALLVPSLKQIRIEQKASAAWRVTHFCNDGAKVGYVRVRLP